MAWLTSWHVPPRMCYQYNVYTIIRYCVIRNLLVQGRHLKVQYIIIFRVGCEIQCYVIYVAVLN